MKFTLSWLKDHLETEASVDVLAEALTDLGLEVEEVIDPMRKLGAFRIARVIEARPHPDANRLRLCRVEVRESPDAPAQEVQVVCGAPNARTGMKAVFAPIGTFIPGTGLELKQSVIRGQESNGMLCSERELEIGDDHDGIIELPEEAPVGARFIEWAGLADPVFHIKITPNRPDALGVRGVARDLAARGLGRLKPLPEPRLAESFPCPVAVSIDPELRKKGCPHFAIRVIRNVKNGPSPAWLQRRLRAIGLRPISALVDVTNYFTVTYARPLHVFDAGKLRGGVLRVHPAQGSEEILALDARVYRLAPGMMAISDAEAVESIAGIMGGERTGVTEVTTEVVLESAYWDPITIAATGRALKITSDARYRFERGVDPAFTRKGLDLAAEMIVALCGGEVSTLAEDGAPPETRRVYRFDPSAVARIVGMEVPEAQQRQILRNLGFELTGDEAVPPSWRPDIQSDVDLVEEIARVASLSRLEAAPLPRPLGVAPPILSLKQKRERLTRRTLAMLGYHECVTYSFIAHTAAALFGGGGQALALENPISSEMTHVRPDLLPGLLEAAARNQARGFMDMALFEVGPAFYGPEPGEEVMQAAAIRVGAVAPRDPHQSRRPADVFDMRADAEAVLAQLGAPARLQIDRQVPAWFHPGRSGRLTLGPKQVLAIFGELRPKILRTFDLRGPVVALVVWPEHVPAPKRTTTTRPALQLSPLMAIERDFAFVVPAQTEAAQLVQAAQAADKELIESVTVFDEFSGPKAEAQLGSGMKSVAITVRVQPREKPLTEGELEALSKKVIERVSRATGARLRGAETQSG